MTVTFMAEDKVTEISTVKTSGTYTVPNNAVWIKVTDSGQGRFYEIQCADAPILNVTNVYPTVGATTETFIRETYMNASINYFTTSVQKLYRIGTTGDWINYQNQPIKVYQGETIYAKGIDEYGSETTIVSSTCNITDALATAAYDGDISTSVTMPIYKKYMKIDPNMIGNSIVTKIDQSSYSTYVRITFLKEDKTTSISSITKSGTFTVPANTGWISVDGSGYKVYEIGTN
jgi:hypothetical protein